MNPYINFVVDIETKGIYDNSIITRLAVTPFKFEETNLTYAELLDRTLYISLDQDEQIAKGRVSDESTMKWWNSQSEELRIESLYPTDNDVGIVEMFDVVKKFLNRWRYDNFNSFLFARNSGFECFKLQSLNEQFIPNTKQVFNQWSWHECKTFNYIFSGGATNKYIPLEVNPGEFQYHNAKHDAAMDAFRMLQLWKLSNEE